MDPTNPKPRLRWYQFSIRTLLLVTSLVAVSLAKLFGVVVGVVAVLCETFLLAKSARLDRHGRVDAQRPDPRANTTLVLGPEDVGQTSVKPREAGDRGFD